MCGDGTILCLFCLALTIHCLLAKQLTMGDRQGTFLSLFGDGSLVPSRQPPAPINLNLTNHRVTEEFIDRVRDFLNLQVARRASKVTEKTVGNVKLYRLLANTFAQPRDTPEDFARVRDSVWDKFLDEDFNWTEAGNLFDTVRLVAAKVDGSSTLDEAAIEYSLNMHTVVWYEVSLDHLCSILYSLTEYRVSTTACCLHTFAMIHRD